MVIIETCPECGHDLSNTSICTYPPILRKECFNCGWVWEEQRSSILRIPFDESNYEDSPCMSCNNNRRNGGSGNCNCTLGKQQVIF